MILGEKSRMIKHVIAALAALGLLLGTIATASANGRHGHGHRHHGHHHHGHGHHGHGHHHYGHRHYGHRHYHSHGFWRYGRWHAPGWYIFPAFGLGLLGGYAISQYNPPVEAAPSGEPMALCAQTYKSFQPSTGLFTNSAGEKKLCPYLK
jgi:hypothetical protein